MALDRVPPHRRATHKTTTTTAANNNAAAATTTAATVATPAVPTTPPAQGTLVTTGAGQTINGNFATAGTQAQQQASVNSPVGVWGATAGLNKVSTGVTNPGASTSATLAVSPAQQLASASASGSALPLSTSKKFPIVPVVAAAGGGVVAIILIVIGVVCCVKRRRKSREAFQLRTNHLRNSFISSPSPAYEKSAGLDASGSTGGYYEYDYGAHEPTSLGYYSAPTYPSRGDYDAMSTFSRSNDYYKPARFAGSAQDRGYGMR